MLFIIASLTFFIAVKKFKITEHFKIIFTKSLINEKNGDSSVEYSIIKFRYTYCRVVNNFFVVNRLNILKLYKKGIKL